ncbi:MAG: formylglycine-generating enzyme family protein, partial [Luteimonas sp.]
EADRLWELNRNGEHELRAERFGEHGGGALARFREALRLRPGQARALQGIAAVESGLIARAEASADSGKFSAAERWLELAALARPGSITIGDARARIEQSRRVRIAALRDRGILSLQQPRGMANARRQLAAILEIAHPGDPAAAELRQRIELAAHYGLFRPGQAFTDELGTAARGPQMRVVPHGGYRMGARDGEADSADSERPQHYVRFDRGFAMSIDEISVGEYRRFMDATRRKTRAARRGYSMAYDERSGNFTRRSGVDWRSDYAGNPAADDLPVLHVSFDDAEAYAAWLSERSGNRYRLPSEAEFEYALRAGGTGRYPWGDGTPKVGVGNVTGSRDVSPSGRRWSNAFKGYGDRYWGPAPIGTFAANAYGLHDLDDNVSEWVADCWHDGYRRAPDGGSAWLNAGCRTRVVRGGSWASSPAQTRSASRAPTDSDTTNARIGFRVVREL